jgi:ankyrin repeat protein
MYYPHGPNSSPIPMTDLYQAIMENDPREVEGLLRHGANPNEPSPPGVFPLIQAMGYDTQLKIAELLIKHGADVNVRTPKNEHGQTNEWTPIFYAIYRKRSDLVAVLLKHHAKVALRDVQGKSPLDWAREVKNAAMVKQIENAGSSHQ